jgi:hypothetical protein
MFAAARISRIAASDSTLEMHDGQQTFPEGVETNRYVRADAQAVRAAPVDRLSCRR